jgi:hypothetical protein
MLEKEDPKVEDAQDPDKHEHQEDTAPIRIKAEPKDKETAMEARMNREKEIVDTLVKRFKWWESWRKPYEDLWNSIYRLYFSVPENIKTPTRAKISIPIIFQIIEATVPKLMNVVFGNDEFFDVIPTLDADQPQADVIKLLLNYQLIQADFFIKCMDFVKQLLLYGTSYFYVYWKVTRKWVWTRTPKRYEHTILGWNFGEVLEWTEKKEWKVTERRPEVEVIDVLDVFPDPDGRTEKDTIGVFVQTWMEMEDVKELGRGKFPAFANTDNENLKGSGDNTFLISRQQRMTARGVSNAMQGRQDAVQVLTWWGKFDLDGDGRQEETQIVIGNQKVLLKAIGNPFMHQKRPVIRCVLFPVPLEWFGLGLVEPVMSLVNELNTLRRQRLDNINLILNRMWKVLNYSDVDLDTLVSTPNGLILVDDMGDVMPLETENVTNQAYTEAGIVQQDIENTTAPKSIQGSPDSGRLGRTARGAQLIIGQALEKFGTASKLFEELGIKRVLRMFHQLNLQFIDNDNIIQDPGLYGHLFDKKITPEMIRAEVDFQMKGISDIVGREGKINQIMSFMGIFGKVLTPKTITALAKKIWELMGFSVKDIEIASQNPPPEAAGGPVAPAQANAAIAQVGNGAGAPPATGAPK